MISSKNVLDNCLDGLKEVRYLSRSVFEECNKRTRLEKGDILLTTVGTLGRSCIFDGSHNIVLQRSVSVLTPLILNDYVKCYLDSGYFQHYIDNNARGTAQKGFYLNLLEATYLPIPPLNEQRQIVGKAYSLLSELGRIDNETSVLNNRIIKAKNKILDLAIHGKLVPQDSADEPATELLKRINPDFQPSDNLHYEGDLPNGWCLTQLKDVAVYGDTSNIDVSSINSDRWISELEDIEKDTARIIDIKTKADREVSGVRHSFKKGQILYSKLRTYLNKVLIAPDDGFCTTEIVPVTACRAILPDYLLMVMRSPYFLEYSASCGHGVKMPRLGTIDAQKAVVPLPPLAEQARIVEKISELKTVLSSLQ